MMPVPGSPGSSTPLGSTAHEGPVDLFKSIHDARAWIARIQHAPRLAPVAEAWADPDRQGTVIRGARTREFTTRELVN